VEYTVRVKVLGAVAVLVAGGAGGLVASTWVASNAYRARWEMSAESERTMTVTGSSRKRIQADVATWSIRVEGSGADIKSAFARNKEGVVAVQEFLAASGVKAEEIALAAVSTQTHHPRDKEGHELPEITGYTLRRDFTVRSTDVARIDRISGGVTELLERGIEVATDRPEFTCSKIAGMKVDLLGDATADARRRADTIAGEAGFRVGEVRTARMGVLQVTQPDSTETSGEGVYDTSTIEKDVTAVVALTVVVEPR
jgi:uncharacterized protein